MKTTQIKGSWTSQVSHFFSDLNKVNGTLEPLTFGAKRNFLLFLYFIYSIHPSIAVYKSIFLNNFKLTGETFNLTGESPLQIEKAIILEKIGVRREFPASDGRF